jgi:putative membrane protein
MDYMFETGFLGTRAPFFMDFVTLIVAVLPFLIFVAIVLAGKGLFRAHRFSQLFLFVFSVVVVGYFEYGVRIGGGFETFVQGSPLSESFVFGVLLVHILISAVTLAWWVRTIVKAMRAHSNAALPGADTSGHKKAGIQTAVGIFLTSLSGVAVYFLLFVF